MKSIIDLSGKTILITGASSGIGAETALLCSQVGAKVILVARREDKLSEVMSGLEGTGHGYFSYDLADLEGIEDLIKRVTAAAGPLDGLVHSAGIPGTRPLKLFKPAALQALMNVNFGSFAEIVRCMSKKGTFRPGCSIVGISSAAALKGGAGNTGYSASKAAMNAAARCMARELAPLGIRVNTVCPAVIRTDLTRSVMDAGGDNPENQMKLYRQYLGFGDPIDVANMAIFLLSDATRLVTGTAMIVDGGLLSN